MSRPDDNTHERPADNGWWADVYDDIFACVADTAKQKRPIVFDPPESGEGARRPRAAERMRPMTMPPLPEPTSRPGLSPLPGGMPATASRPIRVLLADDDEVLLHILGYQLAHLQWEVTCSRDGAEVKRLLEEGDIDLVLVDLNLPHRNAFEILEQLNLAGAATCVIVMSEQVQEDKIVRAFELGAADFVQKPFNPRVVTSRIQRLIGRH